MYVSFAFITGAGYQVLTASTFSKSVSKPSLCDHSINLAGSPNGVTNGPKFLMGGRGGGGGGGVHDSGASMVPPPVNYWKTTNNQYDRSKCHYSMCYKISHKKYLMVELFKHSKGSYQLGWISPGVTVVELSFDFYY